MALFVINISPAQAKGNPKYASIVMDADTGLILSQRYADKSLHPASLTKMMTLMMTFEALESGKIGLRDRIYVSKHAASMVPSKLDLPAGSTIRVKDAIYALVTKSANDVAVAMAEHLGGTESNFARMMTVKAQSLGMTKTRFRNASGLHHRSQVSTARDMAKLARTLINEYSDYYHYFSTQRFNYRGKTYRSHNRLMKTYDGMDGLKTGYIGASGFNLVSSAVRNNQRIVGVVFGGRTSKSRNAHMKNLLDRGFSKLHDIRIASADVPVPPRKPGIVLAYNALTQLKPSSGKAVSTKWAMLNPALSDDAFSELIGQGDSDEAELDRIKAGLMAISAHKGQAIPAKYAFITDENANDDDMQLASLQTKNDWSIQIGAFKSRARTEKAIQKSLSRLPSSFHYGTQKIVPLRTSANDVLFRGRITGYTEDAAKRACKFIKDCMPIAPTRIN